MKNANAKTFAIQQLLASTESSIYEKINTILDSHGTETDVQDFCKLLEYSIKTVRTHLAQDTRIANIGDDIICANYAADNADYNACVGSLLICLELTPNPMYRDDLRLRYYDDILNPKEAVDYNIMRISLENMVIKLNKGKAYVPPSAKPAEGEKSKWANWFPSFSTN